MEKGNRIAIHVLDDFCVPLQRGMQGDLEREGSNKEIEECLNGHGYDVSDMVDAGYFVPEEWWQENRAFVLFKDTEGKWRRASIRCVIFEKKNPAFFVGLDERLPKAL